MSGRDPLPIESRPSKRGTVSATITIESISPNVIAENDPVKVVWTLTLSDDCDARTACVSLLTDDARLLLFDHGTHESPPERMVPVGPGQRISKTTTVYLQRRKGLVDENSRDGTASPFFLLARARNEREEVLAAGAGMEVQLVGLAKRPQPRIFL